ncbi:MAG: hypothetical protein AB7F99_19495, partial [Vicinamibacterales bacterium]
MWRHKATMTETTNRDSLLVDDVGRHNTTPGDNPSKVEHPNGVQVVGGSNPLGPTTSTTLRGVVINGLWVTSLEAGEQCDRD